MAVPRPHDTAQDHCWTSQQWHPALWLAGGAAELEAGTGLYAGGQGVYHLSLGDLTGATRSGIEAMLILWGFKGDLEDVITRLKTPKIADDLANVSQKKALADVCPKGLKNIGDLPEAQRKALQSIWDGDIPVTSLPPNVRQQLADFYSGVAARNPAGSAQAAFNEARAKYLLGQGPNPGRSVNEFSERMGIPKFKRE